jgi:uncharacterized small protein (DUF1192 family)
MADPKRYYIEPDIDQIAVIASPAGDWIKWHDFEDYKAAQHRNASADTNAKLGVEIAEMRSRIAALQAENERLNERVRIKFEKIEDPMDEYLNHVLRKNCAKLEAENERLRKAGDAMLPFVAQPPHEKGSHKAILDWLAAKGVQP